MEKFIDWLKANGYQYKDEDIYLEACTHSSYAMNIIVKWETMSA